MGQNSVEERAVTLRFCKKHAIIFATFFCFQLGHAKCVAPNTLTDNLDGTATSALGLIWKRCAEGFSLVDGVCRPNESARGQRVTYFEAMSDALAHRFQGMSDWRLPTQSEIEEVLAAESACEQLRYGESKAIGWTDFSAHRLVAHQVDAPKADAGTFWTTTRWKDTRFGSPSMYAVSFTHSYSSNTSEDTRINFRLVRSANKSSYEEFNRELAKLSISKASLEARNQKMKEEFLRNNKPKVGADSNRGSFSILGRSDSGKGWYGNCASGRGFIVNPSDRSYMACVRENGCEFSTDRDTAIRKACRE
jgi:Protein of unknown function (DUF1566)